MGEKKKPVGSGTSYQKALELLGLGDVDPAVFFNDFDVLHFVVESVECKRQRDRERGERKKNEEHFTAQTGTTSHLNSKPNTFCLCCAKVVAEVPHAPRLMSSAVVDAKCFFAACRRD